MTPRVSPREAARLIQRMTPSIQLRGPDVFTAYRAVRWWVFTLAQDARRIRAERGNTSHVRHLLGDIRAAAELGRALHAALYPEGRG